MSELDEKLGSMASGLWELQSKIDALLNKRKEGRVFDAEAFRASLPDRLRVMIATPCDDGHRLCFWNSLRQFEHTPDPHRNVYVIHTPPGDSLIPRARNNIAHEWFFKTDCDYLFFIDSDLDFLPSDIWRVVEQRLPLVCGTYFIKQRDEERPCINTLAGQNVDAVTGLQRIACGGTGALCVHRSVMAEMIAMADYWPHWRIKYRDDHTKAEKHHLFSHVVIHDEGEFQNVSRDMSEDWSFCYMARKLGFDVFRDSRAIFLHEGNILYPLSARRLSREEVESGQIQQPDGSKTTLPGQHAVTERV